MQDPPDTPPDTPLALALGTTANGAQRLQLHRKHALFLAHCAYQPSAPAPQPPSSSALSCVLITFNPSDVFTFDSAALI